MTGIRILLYFLLIGSITTCKSDSQDSFSVVSDLAFEQEQKIGENKVLTSSTQSLNRYHSSLRGFSNTKLSYDADRRTINLNFEKEEQKLSLNNIDARFLLPLLPYDHSAVIDDFDKANLTLAEFARNGISLSHQDDNTEFGFFNGSDQLFNDEAEYSFDGSTMKPNQKVRPKRFSIVNNCLNPGLWELSASDAVGEMFHSWFTLPTEKYFSMVKKENNIENSAEELKTFVETNDIFQSIPAKLDILRSVDRVILETTASLSQTKEIGAYSSQDSRRKVQRGFFKILRNQQEVQASTFSDLQAGDIFSLNSFENPGVYNRKKRMEIVFDPEWEKVTCSIVNPKTTYGGQHNKYGSNEYLEIELFSKDKSRSFIAGNIPIQLLAFGEDYRIPAFGAGVLDASENIERRYLRLKEGPYPHYAYLIEKKQRSRPTYQQSSYRL